MIYADCFIKSEKCRAVEFVPSDGDFPIVQFAAKNAEDFAGAAELVYGLVYSIFLLIYFKIICKKFLSAKNFLSAKKFFVRKNFLSAKLVRKNFLSAKKFFSL